MTIKQARRQILLLTSYGGAHPNKCASAGEFRGLLGEMHGIVGRA